MNQLMNSIKNIPGIVGVAIFKDDGTIAAFDYPEVYDKNLLNLIGLKFQPIKGILPEDEGGIVYLCWEFENFLGFYYPVEGGWLNIISSEDIPMPAFTLTMTAVSNKLPKLLKEAGAVQGQDQTARIENVVPQDKIEELKKFFSFYLGPAAPVIFKKAADQKGYTLSNIPVDKLKDILDNLIAKVPDKKKDEVLEKAVKYF